MGSWQSVLEKVVTTAKQELIREETRWAVIGSAATALQGCRVTPRDIDILTMQAEGVHRFVALMHAYTPASRARPDHHDAWHSSREEPVSAGPDDYGFYWTFARWIIDGVKVEVAHIVGPEGMRTSAAGGGIWEAGPEIWPHIREAPFRNTHVPVVPLEIQLATSLWRGLEQRTAAIISVLQSRGYDRALIQKALRAEQLPTFTQLMQEHSD